MKHTISFLLCLLFSNMGSIFADNLSAADIQLQAGEEKQIAINLTNPDYPYVAFQFDLVLPEGIVISKDNKDRFMVVLNEERISDHAERPTVGDLGDNIYRFISYSGTNSAYLSSEGPLVLVTLKADNALSYGTYTASIINAKFTVSNGTRYTLSDVSFKISNPAPLPVITVTAKNANRLYGDGNPEFEYTVVGGTLEGKPELTCVATPISAVGQYEVVVGKGSIAYENVTFVNGTLTIEKAPLTIKADDKQITQGDPLPEFTASYSGFKNGEDESALINKPEISCSGSSDTAPGTYDIVPANAEAQNYSITYEKGILTILPMPVNNDKLMVDEVEMETDKKKVVAIALSNEDYQYVAFQFDLKLPDGIFIPKDNKGLYAVTLNDERAVDHILNVAEVAPNLYRVLAYSGTNTSFLGNEGPILYLTLQTNKNCNEGTLTASVTNQKFTITGGTKYSFDDEYFDIKITRLDEDFITISLSDDWQLFCSNQDLLFNEDDSLKAYIASGIDLKQGFVNMTHIHDVPTGTGVLLIGKSGQSYQVPINKAAYIYSNYLKGVLEDTSIRTGYILDGKKFVPISDTQLIAAGSAYLNVNASASKLDVNFVEGVHSDISPIERKAYSTSTTWFSLQGNRLTGVPQQRGVYINKGHKVYVK